MMMEIWNQVLEFVPQSTLHISYHQIVIVVVLGVITIPFLIWARPKKTEKKEIEPIQETVESDPCPYPNCVRCHQKTDILDTALHRLVMFTEENEQRPKLLAEVGTQLRTKKYKYQNHLQKPVVFYLPSLSYKNVVEKLEQNCKDFFMTSVNSDKILKEYVNLKNNPSCSFKENLVNSGSWKIYHLVDQGKETNNAKFCSKTMKFVKSSHHGGKFMQKTKFTTVAFSCLTPGTVVPEHYGPTNLRIRCQLPLKSERNRTQWIHCGLEKKYYHSSTLTYFDDSFLHSAVNIGTEDRVVLLFDVWHPELSKTNREFLQQIFSCDD